MKKTIGLILAVIMIFSMVPVQVFAASPIPVRAEFTDKIPVSNRYVQNAWVDENGMVELRDFDYMDKHEYESYVYFSNGASLSESGYSGFEKLQCGVKNFDISEYVNQQECQQAIDEGKSKVEVTVLVELERLNGQTESHKLVTEKEIAQAIITDIRLIDELPSSFNEKNIDEVFSGKKFEISYFDGRKEIHEFTYEEEYEIGYIDELHADLRTYPTKETNEVTGEEKGFINIDIEYVDAVVNLLKESFDCPYKSAEILDYEFDGKGGITDITYRLTYTDGRIVDRTCTFEKGVGANCDAVIDTVDDYEVVLQVYVSPLGGDEYQMFLEVGYYEWSVGDAKYGDAKECCSCICHKDGLGYLFGLFLLKIWTLFRINQECRCNASHWY